ncbi:DUF11 domain-containing protein [Vibrio astriarenae]|uniref:DUF11 domain-containing protein n=1 Tax=Vibrio astriarenae TaxID=1481923 RepID=A0A7Z2T2B8_9VIBR|nr:DUF11 domain-containing protein [Vibrio astriarenae]QIA63045.1 DUF11 domain-containing protein [Vibrio astriarenae]
MNRANCKSLITSIAIAVSVMTFGNAMAEPFELDGNPIVDDNTLDDWASLYDSGNNTGGNSLKFTGIVPDGPINGADSSIFTGGRKDIQDVSQWGHKSGSSPDKDEIINAYAAAYRGQDTNGDLIIYFGADRTTNVGDAFLGFWFFKNPIDDLQGGSFDGMHTEGDVLVLANFPQANNATPEVLVVLWDPSCSKADSNNPAEGDCAAKNLRLIKKNQATCNGGGVGNAACAVTNAEDGPNDPTAAPWQFEFKGAALNEFPYETFYEGGINITQLIGGEGCFSSFMAETRSSSSFTASLKDYVLEDFNLCSFAVAKRCKVVDLNSDNTFKVDYEIDIINTGVGEFTADKILVIEDEPSNGTPFTINNTLGNLNDGTPLSADETITISGRSFTSTINGGTNTITSATIQLAGGDVLSATNVPLTVACDSLPLSPLLTINKSCELSLEATSGLIAVKKNYGGTVCNTGDIPLDVTLTDSDDVTLNESFSLDYAKRCDPLQTNACGTGETCTQYTQIAEGPDMFLYACQDDGTGEFVETIPGGDGLCYDYSGEYNPDTLPTGESYSLSNTANAKATSPVVPGGDLGDLTSLGESATTMCQLCPECEDCEPKQ